MAKLWEKFTKPFRTSKIPFLLAEIITDGQGEMVDLLCRFLNPPAAALLGVEAGELRGRRFSTAFSARSLEDFAPLAEVAFRGSAGAFGFTAADGTAVDAVCYQPLYGFAACVLEAREDGGGEEQSTELPAASAVLELGQEGLRLLTFSRGLCTLTGWTRRELLDRHRGDLSALTAREDWPSLLQELLDAAREQRTAECEFRLLWGDGGEHWVELRAEPLPRRGRSAVFQAVLTDIDCRRRSQAELAEALEQLERARETLETVFGDLPAAVCLLDCLPQGGVRPLRLSDRLGELLEQSREEVFAQTAQDPLGRVLPGEREALLTAAGAARAAGTALRRTIRVQTGTGKTAALAVSALWRPRPRGGALLCLVCADVTEQAAAEEELRFQAQLCELLLDRSHIIGFDYDPASDTARIEGYDAGGRRTTRTLAHYLKDLPESAPVHPEDRQHLTEALRRAVTRPIAETLEYRGNYSGSGWRWYRVSWVSLFDSRGNIYRLLGKAEDVTDRKAAEQRYRDLLRERTAGSAQALCYARLDLTANRILDARGGSGHLARLLFANTAEECLSHVADNIPEPGERERFSAVFCRETLPEAVLRGASRFSVEHGFLADAGGSALWVRSVMELAENPDTRHLEGFFRILDEETAHRRDAVLLTLTARDYAFVLTVNSAGICRSYGAGVLPESSPYGIVQERLLHGAEDPSLRRETDLETVRAALERRAVYGVSCPGGLELRWSWMDRDRGLLLLTGRKTENA